MLINIFFGVIVLDNMILTHNRLGKINLILLLVSSLMCASCREERTGCVSLIFDEQNALPRGMMEDLKEEIIKIEYVQKAEVLGFPDNFIDIELSEQKLEAYGVDKEDAVRQIQKQMPEKSDIDAIKKIYITTKGDWRIYLQDIALLVVRQRENEMFYRGRRVYVINIEYDKEMRGRLIDKLERFREASWMEFELNHKCADFYKQQAEGSMP
jgi:multidrug efflux pump subunit AcrB